MTGNSAGGQGLASELADGALLVAVFGVAFIGVGTGQHLGYRRLERRLAALKEPA